LIYTLVATVTTAQWSGSFRTSLGAVLFLFLFLFYFCSSGDAVLGSSSRLAPLLITPSVLTIPYLLSLMIGSLAACLISLVFGCAIDLEYVAILGPVDETTLVLLLVSLGAYGQAA
jgi:hypothetical protein